MSDFASRITRLTVGSSGGTAQLLSGQPVKVWGFLVSNSGTGTTTSVNIESGDGTTTYAIILLDADDTVLSDIPFMADQGLRIKVTGADFADIGVTVFHSAVGS